MAAPSTPAKKNIKKGTPPGQNTAPTNNTNKAPSGEQVALNFKVDAEYRKDFKLFAGMHDLTQKELLEAAFQMYKESKGG